MPELFLNYFRSCAGIEKQTRVSVSEGMEATARNGQEIEHWPKPILHYLVG
jgi:hypothetical protein